MVGEGEDEGYEAKYSVPHIENSYSEKGVFLDEVSALVYFLEYRYEAREG